MKPVIVFSSSAAYSAALRRVFTVFLNTSHEIVEAADGEALVDDPGFAERVLLVILDTTPNRNYDGFRLLERLKSSHATADIPVIVVATRESRPDRIKALALDASEYLANPFSKHELVIKCKNLIDHYVDKRNVKDGLHLLSGSHGRARSSGEENSRLKDEMDSMLTAQEAVFEMSRQELLKANEELQKNYEEKLRSIREKSDLQLIFGKYVSPQIVEYMLARKDKSALFGEKRDVSILFADIRGFTAMTENLEPFKIIVILNEFFTELTETVVRYGGFVDKYIGDNVMAIFGAPVEAERHACLAVEAAVEMQRKFNVIQRNWRELYSLDAGLGIGVNCGQAIVGNIGCYQKLSYTAVGDMVNTAARFEGLARDGQVVFGDAVKQRLSAEFLAEHGLDCRPLGEHDIRGRQERLRLWALELRGPVA